MTDVFFSYSTEDRERAQPIHDALVEEGFDVFWDRELPPDSDWDGWVQEHIGEARCVLVLWSWNSVESDEIAHEAMVAKNAGKLISAVLEPLDSVALPMGHSAAQAVIIPEEGITPQILQRLCAAVEGRVMRPWMRRKLAGLEGQVLALTSTRGAFQDREAILQKRVTELEGQIEFEGVQKQQLEEALTAAKLETEKARELAASSVMLEQTVHRLNNQLLEEMKNSNKLRTEIAYLESRAPPAPVVERVSEAERAQEPGFTYAREVYLLVATMLLLISAANGSLAAMVVSAMLLIAGVLWGLVLR
jgi:hypothetical protein